MQIQDIFINIDPNVKETFFMVKVTNTRQILVEKKTTYIHHKDIENEKLIKKVENHNILRTFLSIQ